MLILYATIAVCIVTVGVGFFFGRKHKSQWRLKVLTCVNDVVEIEEDDAFSEQARINNIIRRFGEIGFELIDIDGKTMEFMIPKNGFWRRLGYINNLIILGPLLPAFLLGHLCGCGGLGESGERLSYFLDTQAKDDYSPCKTKWYYFWK